MNCKLMCSLKADVQVIGVPDTRRVRWGSYANTQTRRDGQMGSAGITEEWETLGDMLRLGRGRNNMCGWKIYKQVGDRQVTRKAVHCNSNKNKSVFLLLVEQGCVSTLVLSRYHNLTLRSRPILTTGYLTPNRSKTGCPQGTVTLDNQHAVAKQQKPQSVQNIYNKITTLSF